MTLQVSSLQAPTKSISAAAKRLGVSSVALVMTLFPSIAHAQGLPPASTDQGIYNTERLEDDAARLRNRLPLSQADEIAKDSILKNLGYQSGFVTQTDTFDVQWVASAQSLMVDILSPDADQAKGDSEQYLMNLGLSTEGICDLPVTFNVAPVARQTVRNFDPVPDGCEIRGIGSDPNFVPAPAETPDPAQKMADLRPQFPHSEADFTIDYDYQKRTYVVLRKRATKIRQKWN
jgi:hypothetical protein